MTRDEWQAELVRLIVRFGYASFIGAYENAQALEETRAEWLAKRGQR